MNLKKEGCEFEFEGIEGSERGEVGKMEKENLKKIEER